MYAGAENDLALVDAALTQRFADVHHELSALLRHWVLEHILKSDLAMRPHVEAMRPYAAKMSSLWAVKPVLLVPNLDKPEAAKHAIASAKGWMNAAFRDESQPPPEAPAALPTRDDAFLAKLHQKAREIGMTVTFDSHCENVQSKDLRDVLAAWRKSRAIGPGSQHFSFTPTPERNFVECTALLQRTEMASGAHRYRAISTGAKYARIFGDIAGHNLEVIEAPAIFARWKLLIDAVLEFGAPLRVVGLARAFGRDDLAVESILAPFQDRGATVEDVLGATSYDLSFEG
ncbi:hypothetical protein GCM10008941_07880 [Rhizomicrobium palustre]